MLVCDNCEFDVNESFDYCPRCGTLFSEFNCDNHSKSEAEGVCLICEKICCSKCGLYFNDMYLCDEHNSLEIYQNMVKIHGSSDSVQIDFLISTLIDNNFHPVKFDRKNNPISGGGSDYTLFKAFGDSSGHLVNEIKILVPFVEYLKAYNLVEEVLKNKKAT